MEGFNPQSPLEVPLVERVPSHEIDRGERQRGTTLDIDPAEAKPTWFGGSSTTPPEIILDVPSGSIFEVPRRTPDSFVGRLDLALTDDDETLVPLSPTQTPSPPSASPRPSTLPTEPHPALPAATEPEPFEAFDPDSTEDETEERPSSPEPSPRLPSVVIREQGSPGDEWAEGETRALPIQERIVIKNRSRVPLVLARLVFAGTIISGGVIMAERHAAHQARKDERAQANKKEGKPLPIIPLPDPPNFPSKDGGEKEVNKKKADNPPSKTQEEERTALQSVNQKINYKKSGPSAYLRAMTQKTGSLLNEVEGKKIEIMEGLNEAERLMGELGATCKKEKLTNKDQCDFKPTPTWKIYRKFWRTTDTVDAWVALNDLLWAWTEQVLKKEKRNRSDAENAIMEQAKRVRFASYALVRKGIRLGQ